VGEKEEEDISVTRYRPFPSPVSLEKEKLPSKKLIEKEKKKKKQEEKKEKKKKRQKTGDSKKNPFFPRLFPHFSFPHPPHSLSSS